MTCKIRGFEYWRGPSLFNGDEIVCIATWGDRLHIKLGNMVQLWILPATGRYNCGGWTGGTRARESVCWKCPLQHGECYVRQMGVYCVEKAMLAGKYPVCNDPRIFRGCNVRVTAWGEGPAIPIGEVHKIRTHAKKIFGYTHRWQNHNIASRWGQYLMASVHSIEESKIANKTYGMRTYRIGGPMTPAPWEVLCPQVLGKNISCSDCGACTGGNPSRRSIVGKIAGSVIARKLMATYLDAA